MTLGSELGTCCEMFSYCGTRIQTASIKFLFLSIREGKKPLKTGDVNGFTYLVVNNVGPQAAEGGHSPVLVAASFGLRYHGAVPPIPHDEIKETRIDPSRYLVIPTNRMFH